MLSRKDLIETVAKQCAADWFASMLNPKYRGSKFKFETFDIENFACVSSSMSFTKELTNKEKETLGKIARLTWDGLIKQSGVLNWMEQQVTAT
jgi:disulfide oxidoreductase YuzD